MKQSEKSYRDVIAAPRLRALFALDQAAKVFDGWVDPDTGLRVLRIQTRGPAEDGDIWATPYHQFQCFLDGAEGYAPLAGPAAT